MNTFRLAIILCGTLSLAGCANDDADGVCPGAQVATWKLNGETFESHQPYHNKSVSYMTLSFAACKSNTVDRVVIMSYVPYPPAVGTYPIGIGPSVSGTTCMGSYTSDDLGDFNTSADHTGTLTITEVDEANHRLSGTFSFTAAKTGHPDQTVVVSEGFIFNTVYPH